MEASLAALRWYAAGYGFDVLAADVVEAYEYGLQAAERLDCIKAFGARARVSAGDTETFAHRTLRTRLG